MQADKSRQVAECERIRNSLLEAHHDGGTHGVEIRPELPLADQEGVRHAMFRELGVAADAPPLMTRSRRSQMRGRGGGGNWLLDLVSRPKTLEGVPYKEEIRSANDPCIAAVVRLERGSITAVDFVYVPDGAFVSDGKPSGAFQEYLDRPDVKIAPPPGKRWGLETTSADWAPENAARAERVNEELAREREREQD